MPDSGQHQVDQQDGHMSTSKALQGVVLKI